MPCVGFEHAIPASERDSECLRPLGYRDRHIYTYIYNVNKNYVRMTEMILPTVTINAKERDETMHVSERVNAYYACPHIQIKQLCNICINQILLNEN
jgi:hypothetical protein